MTEVSWVTMEYDVIAVFLLLPFLRDPDGQDEVNYNLVGAPSKTLFQSVTVPIVIY